jgi:hypothetical protein
MPQKDKEQSNRDKKKTKRQYLIIRAIENLRNNKKNNGTN